MRTRKTLLLGLSVLVVGIPKLAPAQSEAAPTTGERSAPTISVVDPSSACERFVAAELSGKPLDSSELPEELQKGIRSRLDVLAQCRAFVGNSVAPCMALPTAARQKECKSEVIAARERLKNANTSGRTGFARDVYTMCKSENSDKDCRKLERAVQKKDPKPCSELKSAKLKTICKAWALGDPAQCGSEGDVAESEKRQVAECEGGANQLANIDKEGLAALPPDAPPEEKLLRDILMGRSKDCEGLVEMVKADCIQHARTPARQDQQPTPFTPAPGPVAGMTVMPTPATQTAGTPASK